MAGKLGAAVVSCRRGGASAAFDRLNKYFTICNMTVVGSQYWNQVHGLTLEDVRKDEEGLQTMRTLAQNMAWLLKSVKAADRSNIKKLFMKNALQLISFLKYYRKAAGRCRFFFYVKTIKLHAILNAGSSIDMVIDIHTHTFAAHAREVVSNRAKVSIYF